VGPGRTALPVTPAWGYRSGERPTLAGPVEVVPWPSHVSEGACGSGALTWYRRRHAHAAGMLVDPSQFPLSPRRGSRVS
jgi:hypothetical protein